MSNEIELNDLIDRCSCAIDIAKVVHYMYKDLYKYSKENSKQYQWYKYNYENNEWTMIRDGFKLRYHIPVEVCQKFMERSSYWYIESTRAGVDDENKGRFQERNYKLLKIALQLKNSTYMNSIMKECTYLFEK